MKRLLLVAAFLAVAVSAKAELSPLLGTMNADNVTLYTGLLVYPAGGFHPSGLLYTITAPVSTGTGTGAQTLGTYSLGANSLDAVGRKVLIKAAFSTAANTNNKTCTLNFGSESVSTGVMAVSAETAQLSLVVTKTGSNTQTVWGAGQINTTLVKPYVASATETDTAAITIAAICTDGTSSASDATLVDFFIEYMN